MSGERIEMTPALYDYLDSVSLREAPKLAALREETLSDPRHNFQVSPMQGQFMQFLVRALGARRIVEVGVYTGYSSLAMALAMPADGRLWCFDVSEDWAAMAKRHWAAAGVADRIEFRLTTGEAGLKALVDEGHAGSIDLAFLDADKPNYPVYWDLAHTLLRPGGVVIADNTLYQGAVTADLTDDKLAAKWADKTDDHRKLLIDYTHGVRAFNEKVRDDDRFDISMVPVGDGMTFGLKR
jgi:predicted O-methyltransferase YrrM